MADEFQNSDRPAIWWSPVDDDGVQSYWSVSDVDVSKSDDATDGSNGFSISYGSLLLTAKCFSDALRERLDSIVVVQEGCVTDDGDSSSNMFGIPVVVAIPEGPLLPIAVLAVHLLNEPSDKDGRYAVLVPLEPDDGMERLSMMIQDASPALILCLPRDMAKLSMAVCCKADEDGPTTGENGLYSANTPELVDVSAEIGRAVSDGARNRLGRGWRVPKQRNEPTKLNRISHIVYTSGTTGVPKGCISSIQSLRHYLKAKNKAHGIGPTARVLLASALSFDPCLSDILATFEAKATLVIAPRARLLQDLATVLRDDSVSHVLCTPTLWSTIMRPLSSSRVDFPSLQMISLGGEPIPPRIVAKWARKKDDRDEKGPKLCATYGVTEACVYQTIGQVFHNDISKGDVGLPLEGLSYRICKPDDSVRLEDVDNDGEEGEVVLYGRQLDKFSGYLNRDNLTRQKFLDGCYRTGDLGFKDQETGHLRLLGRINGEDGMVKINGVRIELGEVEAAIVDGDAVVDCVVIANTNDGDNGQRQLHAYCVLSTDALDELNLTKPFEGGILCTAGPLLTLIQTRCGLRMRKAALPSAFVLINQKPLSPTGKCDRRQLPQIEECRPLVDDDSTSLWDYGRSGYVVADEIVDALNLQDCQRAMVTTKATFFTLGGDSLAATRLVRSLYARHHEVHNSRFLGGEFGNLDGPFHVCHFLAAESLASYVDFLDQHDICSGKETTSRNGAATVGMPEPVAVEGDRQGKEVYEALVVASTRNQTSLAIALLNNGADPNWAASKSRLSKVNHSRECRTKFKSNPLHVACAAGNTRLVRALIEKGCKFNTPNASGQFPLHLNASGTNKTYDVRKDDLNRREIARLLLDAGAPIQMKDAGKQTVLHAAARTGHVQLLSFLMGRWETALQNGTLQHNRKKHQGSSYDWMDRWYRTPVHWAILNGKPDALEILLRGGCSANPSSPPPGKGHSGTSAKRETPTEICERMYSSDDEVGKTVRALLEQYAN